MNRFRFAIVVTMAIVSILVSGKSLVAPAVRFSEVSSFQFPESVPLVQSKLLFSGAVNPHLVRSPAYMSGKFIAGRHYRYLHHEKYLDIEMRYLSDTNGDLKSFITNETGELFSTLKQNQAGFYSIYADEDKAYLSACINSSGGSTVTNDQFNRNRLIYDTRLKRVFPWLLGRMEVKDRRCMWAHLAISLDNKTSQERTYNALETAWLDWHSWWQSNFPKR